MEKYYIKGYAADLLKTFRTKEQAEQFMGGDLYMGRLSAYRLMEDRILGVRDPFEGKIEMNLPEGYGSYIDYRALKSFRNSGYDGSGQHEWVKVESRNAGISFVGCDDVFVLCATDIGTALNDVVGEDGTGRFSGEYLKFAKQYAYGDMFSSAEIAEKLTKYAKNNDLTYSEDLVEYVDETIEFEEFLNEAKDSVAAHDFIFHKKAVFQDQHEYRFALLPTIERINRKKHISIGEDHIVVPVGVIESSFMFCVDGIDGLSFRAGIKG